MRQVVARVRLSTVPVFIFRKAVRGQLRPTSGRGATHRLLSVWAAGRGAMADGHGLLMQFSPDCILMCYAVGAEGLHFRMLWSTSEEAKLSGSGVYSYLWTHGCVAASKKRVSRSGSQPSLLEAGAERTRSQILLESAPLDTPKDLTRFMQCQQQLRQTLPEHRNRRTIASSSSNTSMEDAMADPSIEYCNADSAGNDAMISTLHKLFLPSPYRRLSGIMPVMDVGNEENVRPVNVGSDNAGAPGAGPRDECPRPVQPSPQDAQPALPDTLHHDIVTFLVNRVPVHALADAAAKVEDVIRRSWL